VPIESDKFIFEKRFFVRNFSGFVGAEEQKDSKRVIKTAQEQQTWTVGSDEQSGKG
jgi:hypothetical protein